MAKTKVRSTIEPGVVIEVDDAELLDLTRQGLIHSSESGEHGSHKWRPEDAEATAEADDKKKGA